MSLEKFSRKPVRTVGPACTVVEAAREMIEFSVGALVITDPTDGSPVGIITDRDIVVLVAQGSDPRQIPVSGLARSRVQTVSVDQSLHDAARTMREHGVRRLPIVDKTGRLAGIVTLDDLIVLLGQEMADLAETIETGIVREAAAMGARAKKEREGF